MHFLAPAPSSCRWCASAQLPLTRAEPTHPSARPVLSRGARGQVCTAACGGNRNPVCQEAALAGRREEQLGRSPRLRTAKPRAKAFAYLGPSLSPAEDFVERSRSLNENKCKNDRYICNLLPRGLHETLNLLARRGSRWLPTYFLLNGKVTSDQAGSLAATFRRGPAPPLEPKGSNANKPARHIDLITLAAEASLPSAAVPAKPVHVLGNVKRCWGIGKGQWSRGKTARGGGVFFSNRPPREGVWANSLAGGRAF